LYKKLAKVATGTSFLGCQGIDAALDISFSENTLDMATHDATHVRAMLPHRHRDLLPMAF